MKSKVKNHGCWETSQSGQVLLVLPNKPITQLPKNDVQKFFLLFILHLNCKQVQKLTKVSNKIQLIKRL